MFKDGRTIRINHCAAEFYILEALELKSKELDSFKKSHERFKMDLQAHKERFEKVFSIALRDYLVYACFGEARNSRGKCEYFVPYIPSCCRSSSANEARNYTPESIATVTQRLFNKCHWANGYGGESWGRIAEAIDLYDQLPTTAFIDHCIDLSHNGGTMFDKVCYSIFEVNGNYADFLTAKSQAVTPEDLIETTVHYGCHRGISSRVQDLLQRAVILELIPENLYDCVCDGPANCGMTVDYFMKDFSPTEWGDQDIPNKLEENSSWCHECNNENEECCCEPWCHDCDNPEDDCECYICAYCNQHEDDCDCYCPDCDTYGYECQCEEECDECDFSNDLCECEEEHIETGTLVSNQTHDAFTKTYHFEGKEVKVTNVRNKLSEQKQKEKEEGQAQAV